MVTKKVCTVLLSNFSNWFFKVFAKMIRKLLIQPNWFNLLPFLVVRFIQESFFKFTCMLSVLESNILQCIFRFQNGRLKQLSECTQNRPVTAAVGVACFKSIVENY